MKRLISTSLGALAALAMSTQLIWAAESAQTQAREQAQTQTRAMQDESAGQGEKQMQQQNRNQNRPEGAGAAQPATPAGSQGGGKSEKGR